MMMLIMSSIFQNELKQKVLEQQVLTVINFLDVGGGGSGGDSASGPDDGDLSRLQGFC